jgi:MerR family transcriptional regulator, redox-sensitive transcriptional activator SoxR
MANKKTVVKKTVVKKRQSLSVGQVAKRVGVKVSTLHFYEQKGLITSWRNTGNQRRYYKDVIRQISLIKAAQKLGISLDEIQQAINQLPNKSAPSKQDWQMLASHWQTELDQRIASLINLRDSLTGCIGCGCLSMKACPLYNPDDRLASDGPGPVLLD